MKKNGSCETRHSSLNYATATGSPHGPRTVKQLTGARGHGLGLSWKLLWRPKEPELHEIRAHLLFAQCKPV